MKFGFDNKDVPFCLQAQTDLSKKQICIGNFMYHPECEDEIGRNLNSEIVGLTLLNTESI